MTSAPGCPRCGTRLFSARSHNAEMLGCADCGGIWLDNASSRRVIDVLCADTLDKAEALSRFAARHADRSAPIACPSCRVPMQRWTVAEANVEVDYCATHGAWFDRNELAIIARTHAARRAYGGGQTARGAALAAGGVVAASALAADPSLQARARQAVENVDGETVLDIGVTALEYVDPVDVVEGAGVVAEAAGGLFGVIADILSNVG
jgi:Zn-finger nucleic acid-binding protein